MLTRCTSKRCLLAGAASLFALAGCASTPVQPVSVTSQLGQGVTDANGELVSQLDFLDRLEGKRVTTWDEMLSGILLTANKRVGPTYSARLGQARSFGLVGPDAPSNGDTPATPAALARALLRARGERFDQRASSEELVAIAQQRGLLPARLSPNDILSGAVTVGALVAVGEPTTRSPLPARSTWRAGQASAGALRPMPEPLASPVRTPTGAPVAPGPQSARAIAPAAPVPAPAPAPVAAGTVADAFSAFDDPPATPSLPATAPAPASPPVNPPATKPVVPPKVPAPADPGVPQVRPEPLPAPSKP